MAANDKLTRYLEAVDRVRADRSQALDAAARADICRELGMSDEDLAAARAEGERDLERGLGFLRHESWAEAISALREADALLPDDLRVLSALARAYASRGDRESAAGIARRCLEIDPRHEASFRLLKSFEARPRWMLPAFAVALAAGLASAAIGLQSRRSSPRGEGVATLGPCRGERYCDVELTVRFAGEMPAVAFPVARLHLTPEDARITLAGRLTHRGQTELEELTLDVAFLDEIGREIGRASVAAKPAFAPPLRDGDSQAFLYAEKVPRGTRTLEARVAERKASPAPPAYGEGEAVTPGFEPAAPSHFGLAVAYRTRKRQTLGDKVASEALVEVTNTGKGIVRALELEWRAVDAGGRVIDKPRRETVVYPFLTPMEPGERRLARLHLYVPGPIADERLFVVKLE